MSVWRSAALTAALLLSGLALTELAQGQAQRGDDRQAPGPARAPNATTTTQQLTIPGLIETPPATSFTALGAIAGSIETIADHAVAECHITADNAPPRAAVCMGDGHFDFHALDPGRYDLTIMAAAPDTGETFVRHFSQVAVTSGAITYLNVHMTQPIALGGVVDGVNAGNCGDLFVFDPNEGIAAPLSPSGSFILNGLAPGRHRLELRQYSTGQQPPTARDARSSMSVDVRTGPIGIVRGLRYGTSMAPNRTDMNPAARN